MNPILYININHVTQITNTIQEQNNSLGKNVIRIFPVPAQIPWQNQRNLLLLLFLTARPTAVKIRTRRDYYT